MTKKSTEKRLDDLERLHNPESGLYVILRDKDGQYTQDGQPITEAAYQELKLKENNHVILVSEIQVEVSGD